MAKKIVEKRVYHKKLTDVGMTVPQTFKFGLIVAVMILWVEFLKTFLTDAFQALMPTLWTGPAIRDFLIASTVTLFAYVMILSYRKIKNRVAKVKVPV